MSRGSRLDLQPASYASSELYGSSLSRQPGSLYNGYQFQGLVQGRLCPQQPSGEPPSPGAPLHRPPTQHDWSSSFMWMTEIILRRGSRAASASTASTLTSLGGTSSRRGSGETSIAVDNEASIREIKDALVEVGEKYRKAMVSNAQLDNEKNNLMYQVDTLKDSLTELEELLAESRREYEEKAKKHGIVLGPDRTINGDIVDPATDGSSESGSRLGSGLPGLPHRRQQQHARRHTPGIRARGPSGDRIRPCGAAPFVPGDEDTVLPHLAQVGPPLRVLNLLPLTAGGAGGGGAGLQKYIDMSTHVIMEIHNLDYDE
ncbi:hypothetical protein CRUP_002608 [Coryphaenoides rupestris]|nr:hypothetical protein CRUP_002608 [Coryphaenoides rupestris]